jgi:hypothetical protein
MEWASLTDAIKVLVGRGDLQVALPPEHETERVQAAQAFNAVVMGRAKEQAPLAYLASPMTGGGIQVDTFTQLYLAAKRKGAPDPVGLIANLAAASGKSFEKGGKALSPDEARAELAAKAAHVDQRIVPLLERLGVV